MGWNMDKFMLITPGDTKVGAALVAQAGTDGYSVALTTGSDIDAENGETLPLQINWNGRSVISARKTVLSCVNTFERLDSVVIINETRQDEKPVHELSPVAIEEYIDLTLKGIFFMLREVLACFVRQGSGVLAMVNYVPEDYTLLPLCAATAAAFKSATDSLSTLYQNENITINGFECTHEPPERFSRFILQALSGKAGETSGRWYRCGSTGRLPKSRKYRK
jgi:NAD(P)-dependent dehydrogenase (short-subunit alcohol dehydrogenase family)